jgi:hypothetical protein
LMLSFGKQGLLRLTGPGGLRVLKLDSGFAAEGCGSALAGADKGAAKLPGFRGFKRCRGFRGEGGALAGAEYKIKRGVALPQVVACCRRQVE